MINSRAAEFLVVTNQKRHVSHDGISPEKVWGDIRHVHVGHLEAKG